jgi:5,10-methylenetetrahydromethanopterin reductase
MLAQLTSAANRRFQTAERDADAEELGYTRAWAFDSPALYGDVWVALARAAG